MTDATQHGFQAEVSEVLSLVIHSLYSNKEIFLRELVSNASDALDKLRFRGLQDSSLIPAGHEPRIRLHLDRQARTLTISDNGIGMTRDTLVSDLGTIARSGSKEFVRQLKESHSDAETLQLIGQFGVGFYSGFLVADRVEALSRAAGTDDAYRWSSEGKDSFEVADAERAQPGTDVILHLKEEELEWLEGYRIRELIQKYSDYVSYPIDLVEGEAEPKQLNRGAALWQRPAAELTDESCGELYRHISHDWEAPLTWKHFRIEGTQMFTGLLFVPQHRPASLVPGDDKHGLRLFVRRVFILESAEELVPRHLRFLRGVIDSEDLPLNVSRELLQDSRATKVIRKQVEAKTLDLLRQLAADDAAKYEKFWESFGAIFKEGLHFEPQSKDELIPLLRYRSSAGDGWTTLADYRSRMPEGQPAIYFATGTNLAVLAQSPHLEAVRQRGYEVLYMTDAVDAFAVATLRDFDGKPLQNVADSQVDLGKTDEEKEHSASDEAEKTLLQPLMDKITGALGELVEEVRVSRRLTTSPACLVTPEGGLPPHLERALRAQNANLPPAKRILELNPDHPFVKKLQAQVAESGNEARLQSWIELLHVQAQLAEGSPVEDPGAAARALAQLMTDAAS